MRELETKRFLFENESLDLECIVRGDENTLITIRQSATSNGNKSFLATLVVEPLSSLFVSAETKFSAFVIVVSSQASPTPQASIIP